LGVLRNTSPGRDLVLCRLSGLNLDKTGVIAGMSGSPVYLDDKLLGAVAYAWAYGKEPIAGITPFCQMHGFVEAYERRDLAEEAEPGHVGLAQPLRLGGKDYESVTVSQGYDDPGPRAADELRLGPPHDGPGLLRLPAPDRLHPRHLPAADGQLQDGLAAADRRRHQRRRQHLHRRLARPPARHAAGEDERGPARRAGPHLQRP